MKTETAKQAAELLEKIETVESKIKFFNEINNEEVFYLEISRNHHAVNIYIDPDKELISFIANHAEQYYCTVLDDLNNKLRQL